MALLNKKPNNSEEPKREYSTPKTLIDETIINILIGSFRISKDLRVELVENIKKAIKNAMINNEQLDYAKLVEIITDDYDEYQKAEALGHQLLGAYLASILFRGKPLDIDLLVKFGDEDERTGQMD